MVCTFYISRNKLNTIEYSWLLNHALNNNNNNNNINNIIRTLLGNLTWENAGSYSRIFTVKLKTSLRRNFVYNLQTFGVFCQVHFSGALYTRERSPAVAKKIW